MKAISKQQPFAWLIIHGGKFIENRTRPASYRGPVLIHTGKKLAGLWPYQLYRIRQLCPNMPDITEMKIGGIIGVANLVDCVTEFDSEWFCGPYGLVMDDPHPLPYCPWPGQLGLFDVDLQQLPGETRDVLEKYLAPYRKD